MTMLVSAFLGGLTIGMVLAKWLADYRWRENAYRIQRIESAGRLFKVLPGTVYDDLLKSGAPVVPGENFMRKID